MRNLRAVSFFILVAVLGCQAGIAPAIREKRDIHRIEPHAVYQSIPDAPDCCFTYSPQIPCSRFVYYFPTSGGCTKPGIIFISKRRKRFCANPFDQRVQECIRLLKQIPGPGSTVVS